MSDGVRRRAFHANEKLNLAVLGVGRRGTALAEAVGRVGERVVARCDVDQRRAGPWQEKLPDVPWYQDFRQMLAEQE